MQQCKLSSSCRFRDDIILVQQCKLRFGLLARVRYKFRDDIILMQQCKLSVGL